METKDTENLKSDGISVCIGVILLAISTLIACTYQYYQSTPEPEASKTKRSVGPSGLAAQIYAQNENFLLESYIFMMNGHIVPSAIRTAYIEDVGSGKRESLYLLACPKSNMAMRPSYAMIEFFPETLRCPIKERHSSSIHLLDQETREPLKNSWFEDRGFNPTTISVQIAEAITEKTGITKVPQEEMDFETQKILIYPEEEKALAIANRL